MPVRNKPLSELLILRQKHFGHYRFHEYLINHHKFVTADITDSHFTTYFVFRTAEAVLQVFQALKILLEVCFHQAECISSLCTRVIFGHL